MTELTFRIRRLDVIRLRAARDDDSEPHVNWHVSFTREDVRGYGTSRLVVAVLHAGGVGGWGDVDVGALLEETSGASIVSDDQVAAVLRDPFTLHALYDFARSHLTAALRTIDSEVDVPPDSPVPDVEPFEPAPIEQ